MDWRLRAKALFFVDKKSITEISRIIGVSRQSVSAYLKALTGYMEERERRRNENAEKRARCRKQWDRDNRPERYSSITAETIRQEHETAVRILSRDRY